MATLLCPADFSARHSLCCSCLSRRKHVLVHVITNCMSHGHGLCLRYQHLPASPDIGLWQRLSFAFSIYSYYASAYLNLRASCAGIRTNIAVSRKFHCLQSSVEFYCHCSVHFEPDTIVARLRELAFLNSAATINFRALPNASPKVKAVDSQSNGSTASESSSSDSSDEDSQEDHAQPWQTFHYSGGLLEYVKWLNKERQPFHEPIMISREVSHVTVHAWYSGWHILVLMKHILKRNPSGTCHRCRAMTNKKLFPALIASPFLANVLHCPTCSTLCRPAKTSPCFLNIAKVGEVC